MQAALPMGANKITGMADPAASTDAATKNYVDTATAAFFSTGDVKFTLKSSPDTGWLMFDDGTFGSASSGSSNSNNVANLALFTLLFNAPFTDANLPIFTSGGGATTRAAQVSASAAWAANCRMSLPKALGRAIAIAGSGSGLTVRALAQSLGEETHLLTAGETPALSGTIAGTANFNPNNPLVTNGSTVQFATATGVTFPKPLDNGTATVPVTGTASINPGGGAVHNNMQPTVFLNVMVKI